MKRGKHIQWIVGLAVALPLVMVLGIYWYKFSMGLFGSLSSEPGDWSYFGSYVGGLLAPIYAAIAALAALLMVLEIREQNRFDRSVTMLRRTLSARPSDLGDKEPTRTESRDNLILAISDNVVEGKGWDQVLEGYAARQYNFLDLPFDKIAKRLKEAISIIGQEENRKRQQYLLDWLYLELKDHEYYLLAAYVMSDPRSRFSEACRKMGLFKDYEFRSNDIAARLTNIGFESAKN